MPVKARVSKTTRSSWTRSGTFVTTFMLILPCSVIPGLPRDLFKKAVMSTQPPLDVSKIPDIAGGDSGTTDGLIRPYSVIPGLSRDHSLPRDLLKR